MTTPTIPTVPIRSAKDHPRFSGGATDDAPATRKIDTDAARERVASARTADKASDKPPTRPRKNAADKPVTPPITYTNGMFRAPVTALYNQAGGLVAYVAYPLGVTIQQNAAECGAAWDELAKANPQVRKWLHSMTRTGAWGKLFAAHLPIFMTALMLFGPDSFRERMGGVVADSIDQMTQGDTAVQDPN